MVGMDGMDGMDASANQPSLCGRWTVLGRYHRSLVLPARYLTGQLCPALSRQKHMSGLPSQVPGQGTTSGQVQVEIH